jgi:hypothetical protein
LVFDGNILTFVSQNGEKSPPCVIKIDATVAPAHFDLEDGQGIYEIKGDTLRICWAGTGLKRPNEFKAGANVILLSLKRYGSTPLPELPPGPPKHAEGKPPATTPAPPGDPEEWLVQPLVIGVGIGLFLVVGAGLVIVVRKKRP